jgi:hypothetical protein
MDASHILVGGLIAISVSLLIWIETRSRRSSAGQTPQPSVAMLDQPQPATKEEDLQTRIIQLQMAQPATTTRPGCACTNSRRNR